MVDEVKVEVNTLTCKRCAVVFPALKDVVAYEAGEPVCKACLTTDEVEVVRMAVLTGNLEPYSQEIRDMIMEALRKAGEDEHVMKAITDRKANRHGACACTQNGVPVRCLQRSRSVCLGGR